MLKLTMDYKMTKHMLNNCTIKESRTWLLVCTRHCYFIPFNHEHPVHAHVATFSLRDAVLAEKKRAPNTMDTIDSGANKIREPQM